MTEKRYCFAVMFCVRFIKQLKYTQYSGVHKLLYSECKGWYFEHRHIATTIE